MFIIEGRRKKEEGRRKKNPPQGGKFREKKSGRCHPPLCPPRGVLFSSSFLIV